MFLKICINSVIFLCLVLFSAVAFSADAATDSVKILKITPSSDIELKKGQAVTFEVTVEYNLVSSKKATINMIIQGQVNNQLPLGSTMELISKGSGKMILKKKILIPEDEKYVSIFTPLMIEGKSETRTVESRTFKVK